MPLGSILGPLLFIIFVNDMSDCFKFGNFLLYSDELRIYHKIEQGRSLQVTTRPWKISIQVCEKQTRTRQIWIYNLHKKEKHLQIHLQFIWNKPWKSTIDQRLGSQFVDSKLHLDIHVDTIINRAFRMYEFVFRSWTNCTQSPTYLNLFDFLVRSLLEYSVSIWTPLYDKYIKDLESVQKIRTPDSI